MDAYRKDLYWAQEYAARNRILMLGLFQRAFLDAVAGAGELSEISAADKDIHDVIAAQARNVPSTHPWIARRQPAPRKRYLSTR